MANRKWTNNNLQNISKKTNDRIKYFTVARMQIVSNCTALLFTKNIALDRLVIYQK